MAQLAILGVLAIAIMAPVTMPVPVLRGLVQERFAVSELLTSLFMSINMLGALLTAPVAGALADRIGRHRSLLVTGILADAACFVALTAPVSFGVFLTIRFVEGCAHILALSVLLTLASQSLGPERRGQALGMVGGGMMLGVALGAPIGGMLGRNSAILPLQAGAGLLAGAALIALAAGRAAGTREARPGFREIVAALRAHPIIAVPLTFAFADRFTVGFFTTTFSLYLGRIHGLTPAGIGGAIATFMIPFALLSYPFGRLADRRSLISLLCGGSVVYGIGTMAVGFADPPALYALMFGIGIAAAVMFVPSMLMTTRFAPESIRATALGAFNSAGSLGFILGPLVGGGVSQLIASRADWLTGYRAAFITAGASEILCVALALTLLSALRRAELEEAGDSPIGTA